MSKKTRLLHEAHAINQDFIIMTIPLYIMATFFYGPKVIAIALCALITAKITDRIVALVRNRPYDSSENSSVAIALILALMLPATVRFRIVILAVLIAILVGKEAFGGYGNYPFNPAAVGFCMVGISWPAEIFRYPAIQKWYSLTEWNFKNMMDAWSLTGVAVTEGPSTVLKNGGLPSITIWDMILGNYVGALGITSAIVILSCAIYLVVRKRITLQAPLAFLITTAVIIFFLPRVPENAWMQPLSVSFSARLESLKFEMLSSPFIFASVFLVPEPSTLPKNKQSQILYGILLGIATVFFRYFGAYDLSICFAILIVNATSGFFDRGVASILARRASKKASKKKEVLLNE